MESQLCYLCYKNITIATKVHRNYQRPYLCKSNQVQRLQSVHTTNRRKDAFISLCLNAGIKVPWNTNYHLFFSENISKHAIKIRLKSHQSYFRVSVLWKRGVSNLPLLPRMKVRLHFFAPLVMSVSWLSFPASRVQKQTMCPTFRSGL